ASAGSNGSISPSGSTSVTVGSNQQFDFTPATNYHVDSVLVDDVAQSVAASYTFNNVVANHTIRVVFALDAYTIDASAGANGSITPSGTVGLGAGANQRFDFTPSTNYYVDSVIVDGSAQAVADSFTFTNVVANHTIHVTFARFIDTVTASAGSNGSITPNGTVLVQRGDDQTFTIKAAANYHIDDVLVDGSAIFTTGTTKSKNPLGTIKTGAAKGGAR